MSSKTGNKPPRKRIHIESQEVEAASVRPFFSFDELVSICIEAKKSEKLAPRTIKTYIDCCRYFKTWLDQTFNELSPLDITTDIVRRYLNYLTYDRKKWAEHPFNSSDQIGLAEETVNTRIRYLKSFFRFLLNEKYINCNPFEKVKLQKTDQDKVEAFSEQQVKALLSQPDKNTFVGLRDYVMMLLMLDTGIRISELLSLKVSDIDLNIKVVRVRWEAAKTKKSRELPMSKETANQLQKLLKIRDLTEADPVFVNVYGETCHPTAINKRLRQYADKIGIKGVRVSPHTFRHTFAKFYIIAGGDPFSLQRILGHTDLKMVRRYLQMNNMDLRDQHKKFSPVEHLKIKKKAWTHREGFD